MISLLKEGSYRILETGEHTRILLLGSTPYAWVSAKGIGEILVSGYTLNPADKVLCFGKYRMFEVKNEPNLTDLVHLELENGNGSQGFLLLTGLPNEKDIRKRIVPTIEKVWRAESLRA